MQDPGPAKAGFEMISPVFRSNSPIPPQYTCRGQNVNPSLNIFNIPSQTQSLTLIMHDPDAPGGDFLHWLVWDITPGTESISVNDVPVGAVQGKNGAGKNQYMGPCPPKGTGTHRYVFNLFALDITLDLPAGSSLKEVMAAQNGHVIDECTLTGLFSAE